MWKKRRSRQYPSALPVQVRMINRVCYGIRGVRHVALIIQTWVITPDALDGQPGFKSFVWLSCCAFPSGPAKSRQPTRQHAQATEGEGEKLRLLLRYLDGSSFRSFLSVFTQVMRKSRRQVTRKMVECFERSRPSPRYRREGAHASAPSPHCMNLLRTNYSDEMAQFVFDIAGHRNGVGYFLAQQRLVTLTETVERLLYRVLGHAEFGRDLGL